MKIKNLLHIRRYLTDKTQCFIPRCRAHCCADVPLPEHWVNHDGRFALRAREAFSAVNVGKNEPTDNYSSLIFNTRPVPLTNTGRVMQLNPDTNKMEYLGHRYYYDKQLAKTLGMNPQEAIAKLKEFEAQRIYNYCPFLDNHGRCVVYSDRSRLCREFGNDFVREINHCEDKSSRLDIIKFYLKEFAPKKVFVFYRDLILNALRKPQNA